MFHQKRVCTVLNRTDPHRRFTIFFIKIFEVSTQYFDKEKSGYSLINTRL